LDSKDLDEREKSSYPELASGRGAMATHSFFL